MRYVFNPPPSWPLPENWTPPPGWEPDPNWPPVPFGWPLWIDADAAPTAEIRQPATVAEPTALIAAQVRGRKAWTWFRRRRWWVQILLALLAIGLIPWMLILGGIAAVALGIVALGRGSLPSYKVAGRGVAAGIVTLGLLSTGAGVAIAASAMSSPEPSTTRAAPTPPPAAIVNSAPATSTAPLTTPAPTAAAPVPSRPAMTTRPAGSRAATSARVATSKPAPRRTTRQPPPPAPLNVTIESVLAAGQGNPTTATIRTAPGASCTIEVYYKSGPSTARGLTPKTASGAGRASWTWLVGTRTTPGDWPVTITCSDGNTSATDVAYLTVEDTGKPG